MPPASAISTTATRIVPTVPVEAAHAATAPTTAAAGSVSSQATAIWPATLHCTVARRRPAAAPKIEPVATCVVESAKPRLAEVRISAALAVSAAKPCGVWISLTRLPSADDPTDLEALRYRAVAAACGDAVAEVGRDEGDDAREYRGQHGGQQHLAE